MPPDRTLAPPYLTIRVRHIESNNRFSLSAVTTTGVLSGREHALGLLPSLAKLTTAMNALSIAMWTAGRRRPPTREERVRAQGKTLWALLPYEFKAFYRRLSVQDGDTIAIVGPTTNFPWELVWPGDVSTPLALRRAMFGVTFAITRWPTTALPDSFAVSRLDVIAPSSAIDPENPDELLNLPSGLEFEFNTLQDVLPLEASLGESESDLKRLFDSPVPRILHIAAHGSPTKIYLKDGPIHARDVSPPTLSLGTLSQPTLAFLNSCEVAGVEAQPVEDPGEWPRSDFSTGATWAEALAKVNASAVVVPMWKVNGPIAAKVSVGFYTELLNNSSLGRAMRTQRQFAVTNGDFHPTRFAYAVYGHPNATVHYND